MRGKGNKERLVYLSTGAAQALADWLCGETSLAPCFILSTRAGRLLRRRLTDQAVYGILRKRAEQAGVREFSLTTCAAPS